MYTSCIKLDCSFGAFQSDYYLLLITKFIKKSILDELLGSKRINHLQEYRTDWLFDHQSHSKSNPKPISVPSNLVFSKNHPDSVNHEVWCHILSHLILFMSTLPHATTP